MSTDRTPRAIHNVVRSGLPLVTRLTLPQQFRSVVLVDSGEAFPLTLSRKILHVLYRFLGKTSTLGTPGATLNAVRHGLPLVALCTLPNQACPVIRILI